MDNQIPTIIEVLYHAIVAEPEPRFWPDYLKDAPIKGHGLWSFYRGLQVGLQLANACFER